jgi:hypothetical protein
MTYKKVIRTCLFFFSVYLCSAFFAMPAYSQQHPAWFKHLHKFPGVIYEESKVPNYTLPNPLIFPNGKKVTTPKGWWNKRRPEILHLFETQEYGKSPGAPKAMHFKVTSVDTSVFGGKATRKQVSIYFTAHQDRPRMDLLIYIPNNLSNPAPAFFGLNFSGNQAIYPDPGIKITDRWVGIGYNGDHRADKFSRGMRQGFWPVEAILDRGYAVVTAYYGDLFPDHKGGIKNSVIPLFYKKDQKRPKPDQWGAIGAWAWGLSRGMDYLKTDKDINASEVILIGHSRLGKTALWAGAQDKRFAMVISNSSGTGGADISRRKFGETVRTINKSFPYWFDTNFKKYSGDVDALPIDQHELIALIAPRPVYIQSSVVNLSADPLGQFLAAKHASPVYELLDVKGLAIDHMPGVNQPSMKGNIAYHNRAGHHMMTLYDWERYMDFADKYFK